MIFINYFFFSSQECSAVCHWTNFLRLLINVLQFYGFIKNTRKGRGVGSYFSYILLNEIPLKEIQTMFLQLAKLSGRVLRADLCTDHAHYVKNH